MKLRKLAVGLLASAALIAGSGAVTHAQPVAPRQFTTPIANTSCPVNIHYICVDSTTPSGPIITWYTYTGGFVPQPTTFSVLMAPITGPFINMNGISYGNLVVNGFVTNTSNPNPAANDIIYGNQPSNSMLGYVMDTVAVSGGYASKSAVQIASSTSSVYQNGACVGSPYWSANGIVGICLVPGQGVTTGGKGGGFTPAEDLVRAKLSTGGLDFLLVK